MDLRHMEAFLAVAEELSFTRAAQRLHQVQSGVSATVRALERDLGADLFVRSSRSVELSEAGAAFLPAAQDALAAAQAARDAVVGVTGKLGGTVRIAIATAIDMVDFPRLLGKFHQAHPGVTLTVITTTRGNDGVMAALAEREIDLALLTPTTWPSTVTVHEIACAPVSVVLPVGHPLCRRARISLAELAGADFVDLPAGYGGRIVNDAAFSAAAVRRRVALEVVDLRSASDYVREGLGIGVFPATGIGKEPGLVARALDGEPVQWPVAVVTATERTPKAAAKALLEVFTNEAASSRSRKSRVTESKAQPSVTNTFGTSNPAS